MNPIRLYDFFSGCGGASEGFRQAGIEPVLALDSNLDALNTFRANFRNTTLIHAPIESVSAQTIKAYYSKKPEIKLFCGCAPCQPFTKQKTNAKINVSKDSRRGLLSYFASLIHHCLPELVFVENVPGLKKVAVEDGGPFHLFTKQLREDGYFVDYGVISVRDYGVAQIRRRLVLVASKIADIRLPAATHGPNHIADFRTVRDVIADLPLVAQGSGYPDKLQYPNHRAARLSPLNLERIRHTGANGRSDWPESLLPKCYTKLSNGVSYNGHSDCYTRLAWDQPAPGLTTRCISYSNGRYGHPEQDRAITVREAARLQGFPDRFVFTGSLNSMARQIGNAVPVPVARAFGEHFMAHVSYLRSI